MSEPDTESALEVLYGVGPESPAVCPYGGCPKIILRLAFLQHVAYFACNLKALLDWRKDDENFVILNIYSNKYLFIHVIA